MLKREHKRIVNEVMAMQDDQRYGHFTHPVTLGMLIAADLLAHPEDWPARAVLADAPDTEHQT